MKPLRRLMNKIEINTDFEQINWSETVDPNKTPVPGPVTAEDFTNAIQTTKSSANAVPFAKYDKWMNEFGSV